MGRIKHIDNSFLVYKDDGEDCAENHCRVLQEKQEEIIDIVNELYESYKKYNKREWK